MKVFKTKLAYTLLFVLVFVGGMYFFSSVSTAQVDTGLAPLAQTGLSGNDPRLIAARVIQAALGLLGIIALGLLVYAGFLWMTAAGNDEQITKAKNIMRNGIIGLVIILSAFGIVTFVISRLLQSTGVATSLQNRPGNGFISGGGGFPSSALTSHYPDRDQKNVVRNTNIFITFNQPLLLESVLDDRGTPADFSDDIINANNIKILKASDDLNTGPFVAAKAQVSSDGRNLVLDPVELLGSPDQPVMYQVIIGQGISTAAGRSVFGNFGDYQWQFEVGTIIDLTPPRVQSVIPQAGSKLARNVVVQIQFNEAMNPVTVSGLSANLENVRIKNNNGDTIAGTFVISNQYTTVEFITEDLCGTNSCGQKVFCLPGNAQLTAALKAASLSVQPPQAALPYNGIVDAAANSLDGNLDGAAQGNPTDNYNWSFQTSNEIDLKAPFIVSVSPAPYSSQVSLNDPIRAVFSKPLLFSSVNRANILLRGVSFYNVLSRTDNNQSTVTIEDGAFAADTDYSPQVTANVKDIYQNCYQPCVGP